MIPLFLYVKKLQEITFPVFYPLVVYYKLFLFIIVSVTNARGVKQNTGKNIKKCNIFTK